MILDNRIFLTTLLLLSFCSNSFALPSDKDQPVSIEADAVDIDEGTETAIYRGNVLLTQGSIKLTASRVVVLHFQSENARIVATGKPVKFSQKAGTQSQLIIGKANKTEYGLNSAKLILTGKASLVKGVNTFRNDRIIYDREKAIVKAGTSAKGKERVKITIGRKK